MEQPASVLIVDDSDSTRFLMACILRKAGYQVAEASDGMEALEMATAENYGIVITDLNMPKMSGYDLVTRLRALSDYRFSPILIATAESVSEIKAMGREVRVTGWVSKPIKPDKLLSSLRQLQSL